MDSHCQFLLVLLVIWYDDESFGMSFSLRYQLGLVLSNASNIFEYCCCIDETVCVICFIFGTDAVTLLDDNKATEVTHCALAVAESLGDETDKSTVITLIWFGGGAFCLPPMAWLLYILSRPPSTLLYLHYLLTKKYSPASPLALLPLGILNVNILVGHFSWYVCADLVLMCINIGLVKWRVVTILTCSQVHLNALMAPCNWIQGERYSQKLVNIIGAWH